MKFSSPRTLPDGAILRPAEVTDVPGILDCIHQLAEFEREPDAVENTAELVTEMLFGDSPVAYAHVISSDGEIAGIAIWYLTYSTWTGVPGIHLEDLYVVASARKRGYGMALITALADVCIANNYRRLEWQVLDWNTPAIEFYESLGARRQSDWYTYRLSEANLSAVADRIGSHSES